MIRRAMELAVSSPPADRALPREAMWFFVVAPPILAFLFDPNCVKQPAAVLRALLAITGYTVATGLAVHFGFEALAPRLRGPRLLRVLVHAALCTVVVGAITAALHPAIVFVYPEASDKLFEIAWRGTIVSFVYLGVASFIAHLQRAAVRERLRAHEERASALRSRLAVLQAQMQPHFLFNSLNACAGLVHEQPDAAEETLERLAAFLRHTLESTSGRYVALEEELAAIESYLHVQRARFGERLRYAITIGPALERRRIPPMLLQPLVENAVVHGLRSGGFVRIEATARGGGVCIAIEDDGVGPGRSTHRGTGTGLANVRERLALLYGSRASLRTGRSRLGGFACELVLPAEDR